MQEPFTSQKGQVWDSGRKLAMKELKRFFDEVFMRISLQNREFSLIIVNIGGAGVSQVGQDPGNGRHAGG